MTSTFFVLSSICCSTHTDRSPRISNILVKLSNLNILLFSLHADVLENFLSITFIINKVSISLVFSKTP